MRKRIVVMLLSLMVLTGCARCWCPGYTDLDWRPTKPDPVTIHFEAMSAQGLNGQLKGITADDEKSLFVTTDKQIFRLPADAAALTPVEIEIVGTTPLPQPLWGIAFKPGRIDTLYVASNIDARTAVVSKLALNDGQTKAEVIEQFRFPDPGPLAGLAYRPGEKGDLLTVRHENIDGEVCDIYSLIWINAQGLSTVFSGQLKTGGVFPHIHRYKGIYTNPFVDAEKPLRARFMFSELFTQKLAEIFPKSGNIWVPTIQAQPVAGINGTFGLTRHEQLDKYFAVDTYGNLFAQQ